jgi:hypothetical protein
LWANPKLVENNFGNFLGGDFCMLVEDVECAELIFRERLHYDEELENWILNRYQSP